MLRDLPAPVGAGLYNVYTGDAADSAVPTAAQLGFGAAPILRRMRTPHGGSGPARRLVGRNVSRHGRVDSADLESRR